LANRVADAIALITWEMDFTGLMARARGKTVVQRKALVVRIGEAVYTLFRLGVIDPELDPDTPKTSRKT
jgi:hypothetical protein